MNNLFDKVILVLFSLLLLAKIGKAADSTYEIPRSFILPNYPSSLNPQRALEQLKSGRLLGKFTAATSSEQPAEPPKSYIQALDEGQARFEQMNNDALKKHAEEESRLKKNMEETVGTETPSSSSSTEQTLSESGELDWPKFLECAKSTLPHYKTILSGQVTNPIALQIAQDMIRKAKTLNALGLPCNHYLSESVISSRSELDDVKVLLALSSKKLDDDQRVKLLKILKISRLESADQNVHDLFDVLWSDQSFQAVFGEAPDFDEQKWLQALQGQSRQIDLELPGGKGKINLNSFDSQAVFEKGWALIP